MHCIFSPEVRTSAGPTNEDLFDNGSWWTSYQSRATCLFARLPLKQRANTHSVGIRLEGRDGLGRASLQRRRRNCLAVRRQP